MWVCFAEMAVNSSGYTYFATCHCHGFWNYYNFFLVSFQILNKLVQIFIWNFRSFFFIRKERNIGKGKQSLILMEAFIIMTLEIKLNNCKKLNISWVKMTAELSYDTRLKIHTKANSKIKSKKIEKIIE